MRYRFLVQAVVGLCVLALPVLSQAQSWDVPRTADGVPNIQGVWTNFDPTPFEAPNDIDLERLAPLAAWFPNSNQPQRPPENPDPNARERGPQGPWVTVQVTRCAMSDVNRWLSTPRVVECLYASRLLTVETIT